MEEETQPEVRLYPFRNKNGEVIHLRGDLTMEELIKMGFQDFGFAKPDDPILNNEWRSIDTNEHFQKEIPSSGDSESD
jgi:hypothetical protein